MTKPDYTVKVIIDVAKIMKVIAAFILTLLLV
jgi:hypothetical protein